MKWNPHPFTLRQLQYVVAVAETLNFRKAAERCAVSQPALSAQLAQFEQAIGATLFERDRRGVLLTAEGKRLIERIRAVLRAADDLEELGRAGDPLAGTLRLGIIPTVSPYLLPVVSPALRKRHPELKAVWFEERTETLVARLNEGDLDAAVVALEAELGNLERAVIAKDPFVLATSADHPLAESDAAVSPAELRGEDVLLLDEGHCFREQALAYCSRSKARELEFRATSMPTLAQMAASGAGVTLLPSLAVSTEARRFRLHVRPFAQPAPSRTIALVWRPASPISDALRTLGQTIASAWPRS